MVVDDDPFVSGGELEPRAVPCRFVIKLSLGPEGDSSEVVTADLVPWEAALSGRLGRAWCGSIAESGKQDREFSESDPRAS